MKLIDSHCHLPDDLQKATDILLRAKEAEVTKVINIGTGLKDSLQAQQLNQALPDAYYTIGIYPHEEKHLEIEQIRSGLEKLLAAPNKPVAIGECGIDVIENEITTPLERQEQIFRMQIELAISHKLPLIIHNRKGDDLVYEILKSYEENLKNESLKAVIHCFSSDLMTAKRFLDLGLYLSFTGMITYQTKSYLLDVIRAMPIDKLMLETDSPYLTPNPFRKEINEPKYVRIVAQKVAETINQPLETVCQQTYKNTTAFFNLS